MITLLKDNPVEILTHMNWGKIKETIVPISNAQLNSFASKRFESWKFKSGNNELTFKDGIANDQFRPMENLQKNIKSLFIDFLEVVMKEAPESLNKEAVQSSEEVSCSVYLMKDLNNGSYKIGISNNPDYRERTLQSEKPFIELLHSKEFHKRNIAEIFEKVLHEHFKNKRIRGEWFELSQEDIRDIMIILN